MIVAQSQHRDLLEAIEDGEGARAEFIAREHARLALKNLKHVMKHDRSLMEKVPGLSLVAG
jgi:GntR family transcriptional regulator, vanillate catabolism transcriptional regulator